MATLADLRQRLEQNDARYNLRFAGQPRITRDLTLLEQMLVDAETVGADIRKLGNGAADERQAVQQAAENQIKLYRTEHDAILAAREQGGEAGIEASILGTRANFVFHRYTRHFAGQPRSSRDASLLLDMIAELEAIETAMVDLLARKPMPSLQADLDVVRGRLDQFRNERRNVAQARSEVAPDEQVSILANAANVLFAEYRAHFSGQPRVSRRPELLVRLIDALREIEERMLALRAQGLQDETHEGNIGIVQGRLTAWRNELAAIRAERQKASLASMVADLATAANAEMEAYGQHFAGQARKTRDLRKLSEICDRLDEVERQMTRLDQVQAHAENERNLAIVRDALTLYQNEHDEIVSAQGA